MSASEPGRHSFSISCDGASSLRDIRRWLRLNLPADTDLSYDAELVCTELVTNAIEHSRATCSVRIDIEDGCVHIEVDDDSPEAQLLVGRSTLGPRRGRGLALVDALSTWGVRRTRAGKTVWAVVRPDVPNTCRS